MSVEIISRAAWGAVYRDGDITLTNKAAELFIHHAAARFESLSASEEVKYMLMLERTGYSRFGFGISYNVVVFPSGRAYRGVSWNRRGTHTGGRNSTARSICFAGNFEEQEPTEAALRTAGAIIHEITGKALKPNFVLRMHRAVKATACPGRNVAAVVEQLLTKYAPGGAAAKPVAKPAAVVQEVLDLDGSRGPATITRWQWAMGTITDGVVSRPRSNVVEADQHALNKLVPAREIKLLTGASRLDEDGSEGPKTIRVRQFYLFNKYPEQFKKVVGRAHKRSDYDGRNGPISVKMHQFALNKAEKGKGY